MADQEQLLKDDLECAMSKSPFMRAEFVLKDDHNCNASTDYRSAAERPNRRDHGGSDQNGSSSAGVRRGASPVPHVITNREDDDALYVKVADLPDDVREQVRRLVAGEDDDDAVEADGAAAGSSSRPQRQRGRPFGEPTGLSAQPTIEEIQMCFAQIDLAMLMENKPPSGRARFQSPHDRSAAPASRPRTASPQRDKAAADYAHRVCARRTFRSPPRLVIPKGPLLTTSDSDSSSSCSQTTMPHADSLYAATNAQRDASPVAATINSPQISQMQQLLIERANERRKSAAAAALQKPRSGVNRPVMSDPSSASSPVLGSPLAAAASPYSNMQQQLMERAMARRRMQAATSASTEGVLSVDGAQPLQDIIRSAVARGLRSSANALPSSGDARRAAAATDEAEAQSIRVDFLMKLQQIQQLAAAAGVPKGSAQPASSEVEKESKRAYQLPVWTHRSCSSSSLNGGCYNNINGLSADADCDLLGSDAYNDSPS